MKMMKPFFSVGVAAALLLLLVSCGEKEPVTGDTGSASAGIEADVPGAGAADANAAAYTKYTDYNPVQAVPAKLIPGTDHSVLIAYFSRSGNTYISDDADAISSASLTVNTDGSTLGNTEQIANWIAEETGGDLFLIQTEYTYPVDYDQAVEVGEGQDIDGYHPKLASHVEQMEQYDAVYLVYPIWHYTLSVPAAAFLDEYDLSGKTIYAFAANAGSRFADSIEKIQAAEPNAAVIEGLSVSQREMDGAKDAVSARVRELMEQEASKDEASMTKMNVQVGAYSFTATLEDNAAVRELVEMMQAGPVTIEMSDYSGFEKVGSLGRSLTTSNRQTTAAAGDIVLYKGNNIVMFYGSNSWSYTRIGTIDDLTDWATALGYGDITAIFTLTK